MADKGHKRQGSSSSSHSNVATLERAPTFRKAEHDMLQMMLEIENERDKKRAQRSSQPNLKAANDAITSAPITVASAEVSASASKEATTTTTSQNEAPPISGLLAMAPLDASIPDSPKILTHAPMSSSDLEGEGLRTLSQRSDDHAELSSRSGDDSEGQGQLRPGRVSRQSSSDEARKLAEKNPFGALISVLRRPDGDSRENSARGKDSPNSNSNANNASSATGNTSDSAKESPHTPHTPTSVQSHSPKPSVDFTQSTKDKSEKAGSSEKGVHVPNISLSPYRKLSVDEGYATSVVSPRRASQGSPHASSLDSSRKRGQSISYGDLPSVISPKKNQQQQQQLLKRNASHDEKKGEIDSTAITDSDDDTSDATSQSTDHSRGSKAHTSAEPVRRATKDQVLSSPSKTKFDKTPTKIKETASEKTPRKSLTKGLSGLFGGSKKSKEKEKDKGATRERQERVGSESIPGPVFALSGAPTWASSQWASSVVAAGAHFYVLHEGRLQPFTLTATLTVGEMLENLSAVAEAEAEAEGDLVLEPEDDDQRAHQGEGITNNDNTSHSKEQGDDKVSGSPNLNDNGKHKVKSKGKERATLIALDLEEQALQASTRLADIEPPYCIIAKAGATSAVEPVGLYVAKGDVSGGKHYLLNKVLRPRARDAWEQLEDSLKEISALNKRSALMARRSSKKNAAAHSVKSEGGGSSASLNKASATESLGVQASIRRAWQAAHTGGPPTLKFQEDLPAQGGGTGSGSGSGGLTSGGAGLTRIVGGTADALIEFCVRYAGGDKEYQLTLIMTYDVMCTAADLFDRLARLYAEHWQQGESARTHILEFMKKWLLKRQWQFSSKSALLERVVKWAAALEAEGVDARQLKAFQLFVESQLGGSRLLYRSEMEQQLASEDLAAAPTTHALLCDGATLDVLDLHPIEVARQMTLLEAAMLKAIEAREWIGQGWTRNDGRSPNLVAFVDRFNAVSNWVATVVVSGDSVDTRVTLLRYFVLVAQECLALNNFNGALEILSGLDSAPLTRMAQTWAALPAPVQKQFEALRENVTIGNNYRVLRELVSNANGPAIPYLGMYMADLLFIEEGNPTLVDTTLFNFEKLEMVAKVVVAFEQLKLHRYQLAAEPLLQHFLRRPYFFDEDALFNLSLLRESREANIAFKERLKQS